MVIGVDAGAICQDKPEHKAGVHRVTLELLKHLSLIDAVNTYRLYSFSPIQKNILSQFGSNMVNIPLVPSTGYMKVRLPIELTLHPIDMFLGVSQAMPYGVSKGVGFIYDLGFLHHPDVYGTQAQVLTNQTAALVARSTHIVTISKASKQDIVQTYGMKPENITVVYPGVSDVFIKNTEKMQHSVPYFLMVGINPSKNIPTAMQVFDEFIKKTKKEYDLIIIGGSVRNFLQKFQRSSGVHFVGYVPDTELAKWYKGAAALLALSQTEGFCLPAVEALVSGCPVLYDQSGALSEIVGKAGIGVSIQNIQTITDAMMKLTKEKMKTIVQVEKYSWSVFAQKVYDLCSDINS